MNLPKIDSRTKEDIIQYMKNHLSSYTPEWRFNEENPDVGTALALIYADMMSETIYRFNQVSEKNRVMFFEKLGVKLLPAVPAEGYITFSLVNSEAEGVAVRRGEAVLADTEDGESLVFETLNDLYVTAAKPDCLYLCNKEKDQISKLFEQGEEISFTLFDIQKPNLQNHVLYFSHPSIFHIKSEAWIRCSFLSGGKRPISEEIMQAFLNADNVKFEYYSQNGFVAFAERKLFSGQIGLRKGANQPAFALYEHDGVESYWIRCTVKHVQPFEKFSINKMAIRSSGQDIIPDAVNARGIDQKVREFFPFGERPSLYDEVYFLSDEVLGKKSAGVTLEFDLDFMEFPLEVQEQEVPIDWKVVMKRSELKVDNEYDISITEVIWEYYNGNGFTRLFVNDQYGEIFGVKEGTLSRRLAIHFQCPPDIEPLLVNSSNSYCIRARVLKMANLYKMKGKYISPLVSNVRFQYDYIQDEMVPEYFRAENNLESIVFEDYKLRQNKTSFYPLAGREEQTTTLYMGFEQPPLGGPIKMLFSVEENLLNTMPLLQFEYSSQKGWKNLNVIDETENFRRTGIITMMGNPDFDKRYLFGKERYWIRIVDVNHEYYLKRGSVPFQKLTGIYMNTTQIRAVETKEPERFAILPNEEDKVCQLKNTQIYQLHVWVNEKKTIHIDEIAKIEKEYKVRYEYAANGEIEAIWVEWKEVSRFKANQPQKRCYQVDKITGTIQFPNGRNGKIPTSDEEPTIHIEYSCGGGSIGNLPKHSIRKLNRSIGFISDVDNHEITAGGCNQEQVHEALQRNAVAIRHGYRAVTASDYEALAREASRNICKAKCFANRNETGEQDYGHITLVVLQNNYENGKKHFDVVRSQIMDYMKNHMSTHLYKQNRFHIIEPDFLKLSVTITLQVTEYNQVFDIRTQVLKQIEEFLNPVTGNYYQNGWEIGTIPNTTQILNTLKNINGIHYIENIRLAATRPGQRGITEVDLEKISQNPYVLPLNGKHEMIIKVN